MAYTIDKEANSLFEQHARWWQRQSTVISRIPDSHSLRDLWLPLADGSLAEDDLDLRPEMLDLDRLAGEIQEQGTLQIIGDRFCTTAPYGQIPWLETILGAPVRAMVNSGGMRSQANIMSWEQWENGKDHFDQNWFYLLMRLTEMVVARSNGRFAVTAPTLRGPCDLAEALLGPEMMSLSMYDHPEALERFLEEVTGVFITVLQALLSRIPPVNGGYVNPFGIWAPGTVVRTQCDASVFLSAAHYERWYLPFDLRICEAFDYSIIHLHSCSLHTVDSLLAQKRPHAIQVTLEDQAKGSTLEPLLPTFSRILERKPLLLEGKLDEDQVRLLLKHLSNDGLAITARSTAW